LKADVKINRLGNSGLYFRSRPVRGEPFPQGYEVQIVGSAINAGDRGYTGSLWSFAPVKENLIRDDTWFTLHVIVADNRIVVKIDDNSVLEYMDPKQSYALGYLALQQLDSQTHVFFKNIMVKPLSR
jgi:hypothetical protein